MRDHRYCGGAHSDHAFGAFGGTSREGLCLVRRRNMMKAGLAGIAGLSLPELIQHRASAATAGQSISSHKSVILLWMTGGPSHIDMWDMKPDRPLNNRGPFSPIPTAIPGEFICEHLAQTSGDAGQVHDHPIGRLQEEQSRAEHGHANRTSGRGTARQHNRVTATQRSGPSCPNFVVRIIHRCRPTWHSRNRDHTSDTPDTWGNNTTHSWPTRRRNFPSMI